MRAALHRWSTYGCAHELNYPVGYCGSAELARCLIPPLPQSHHAPSHLPHPPSFVFVFERIKRLKLIERQRKESHGAPHVKPYDGMCHYISVCLRNHRIRHTKRIALEELEHVRQDAAMAAAAAAALKEEEKAQVAAKPEMPREPAAVGLSMRWPWGFPFWTTAQASGSWVAGSGGSKSSDVGGSAAAPAVVTRDSEPAVADGGLELPPLRRRDAVVIA